MAVLSALLIAIRTSQLKHDLRTVYVHTFNCTCFYTHMHAYQVVPIIKFINEFVVENPFIVCSEELSYVRKELCRAGDEVKVRQKAGTIRYKAIQGRSDHTQCL